MEAALPYRRRTIAIRWLAVFAAVACAVVVGLAIWKFQERHVIQALQGATRCKVTMGKVKRLWFPRPGVELSDVSFERSLRVRVATLEVARLEGSWLYLLTLQKRLALVEARGLKVDLPKEIPPPYGPKPEGTPTYVDRLVANGATVRIAGAHFAVQKLSLSSLNGGKPMIFATQLQPPHPRESTLQVDGELGPFHKNKADVRIRGKFHLTGAQLASYPGIAGVLDGEGRFEGPLGEVQVRGNTRVAAFEVNGSGHPTELKTTYRAIVDGQTGQVTLNEATSTFMRTSLSAKGIIDRHNTVLDFDSKEARIDDLLLMFTKTDVPALKAPIMLTARAELPSGSEPFLKRLKLDGSFRIDNAVWARPRTQDRVNSLSSRARGNAENAGVGEAGHVVSDLQGDVRLRSGTATLSRVVFRVPGAVATGGGQYNLPSKHVNLHGSVRLQANASEASSGWKSVLIKPLNFIFRKADQGKRGATLPVHIVGTFPRPQFRIGMTK